MTNAIVWLLVVFTGIAFGAGIYEARVEVPQWFGITDGVIVWEAATAAAADPGLKFWAFVTTGPITILTLISLWFAWKSTGTIKKWWIMTALFLLIDRAMTFGYFIPTMAELMTGTVAQMDAVRIAQQWQAMNVVRLVASGASFFAAIRLLVEMSRYSTSGDKK